MSDVTLLVKQLESAVNSNDQQSSTQLIPSIRDVIEAQQLVNQPIILVDTLQSLLNISDHSSNIRLVQSLWKTINDLVTKNQSINQSISQSQSGRTFIQNALSVMSRKMTEAEDEAYAFLDQITTQTSVHQSTISEAGLRFKLVRLPALHVAALLNKFPDQSVDKSIGQPISHTSKFVLLIQRIATLIYCISPSIVVLNDRSKDQPASQASTSARTALTAHFESLLLPLVGSVASNANQSTIQETNQLIYQSTKKWSDTVIEYSLKDATLASSICVSALILHSARLDIQATIQSIERLIEMFERCSVHEYSTLSVTQLVIQSNSQSIDQLTNPHPAQCLSLTVAGAVYQSINRCITQSIQLPNDSMVDESQSSNSSVSHLVNQVMWRYIGHPNPSINHIFRLVFMHAMNSFGSMYQSVNLSIAHQMLAQAHKQSITQSYSMVLGHREQVVVDLLALIIPLCEPEQQRHSINQLINRSIIDQLKAQLEQRPYQPSDKSDDHSINQSQPVPMNDGGMMDDLPNSEPANTSINQSINQISPTAAIALLSKLPLSLIDQSAHASISSSVLHHSIALFSDCINVINQSVSQSTNQSWLSCFNCINQLLVVLLKDGSSIDRLSVVQLRSSIARLFSNKAEQSNDQTLNQATNQYTNQFVGRLTRLIDLIQSVDVMSAHLVTTNVIDLIDCMSISQQISQPADQSVIQSINQSILQRGLLIKALTGVALMCAKVPSASVNLPQLIDRLLDGTFLQSINQSINPTSVVQALINTVIVLCHNFSSPQSTSQSTQSLMAQLITMANIQSITSIVKKLQSINQSTIQTNQPINQSINQSAISIDSMFPVDQHERINRSINQYNESINQSINQFIFLWMQQDKKLIREENELFTLHQSIKQSQNPHVRSINQSVSQSVNQSNSQFPNQSIDQSNNQSNNQSVDQWQQVTSLLSSLRSARESLVDQLQSINQSVNKSINPEVKALIEEEQRKWKEWSFD